MRQDFVTCDRCHISGLESDLHPRRILIKPEKAGKMLLCDEMDLCQKCFQEVTAPLPPGLRASMTYR